MRRAALLALSLGGCHLALPHHPPAGDAPLARPEQSAREDRSRSDVTDAARADVAHRDATDAARGDVSVDGPRPDAPRPDAPRVDAPPDVKVKKDLKLEPSCSCPVNMTCCLEAGPCIDTETDPKHCGGCFRACAAGQICVNGACVCNASSCSGCCAGNACVTGSNLNQCSPSGLPGAACGTCPWAAAACNTYICQGGRCKLVWQADNTGCNDGNLCTSNDTCQKGVCVGGTSKICAQPPPCKVASCDPATGQCNLTNASKGTACTLPCATGATCDGAGSCTGGVPMPNGTPCGDGSCCEGQCCFQACCPAEVGGPCKAVCMT